MECTDWMFLAWNSTLDRNDVPSAWLYGQDHLWATQDLVCSPREPPTPCSHPYPPPPLPSHPPPSFKTGLKLMHTFEKIILKGLKSSEEQLQRSTIFYSIDYQGPILLNKSSLVRAKAGNFNLKCLNRCFSNYYKARTWSVFAETVTYTCNSGNTGTSALPDMYA